MRDMRFEDFVVNYYTIVNLGVRNVLPKFYFLMRDTLFKMVLGELRHANEKCHDIDEIIIVDDKQNYIYKRNEIYSYAYLYDPIDTLEKAIYIFDLDWKSQYGGEAWKKIAEVTLQFFEIKPTSRNYSKMIINLEKAIYLAHNGGIAYDKPTSGIIYQDKHLTKMILDYFRKYSFKEVIKKLKELKRDFPYEFDFKIGLETKVFEALKDFIFLERIPIQFEECFISERFEYKPIEYGDMKIEFVEISEYSGSTDYDDYEYYDDYVEEYQEENEIGG